MKPVDAAHYMINSEAQKNVRNPVQQRGIRTKEKIIAAAYALFCEKGYYKTTTNEIAQRANVSIGSLYAYFDDKDVIFFEILELYHQKFVQLNSDTVNHSELFKKDIRQWLRLLIESQIKIHEESKEFNRELNVVSYYNKEIDEILTQNKQETMANTIGSFSSLKDDYPILDIEAFIVVVFNLISVTVDTIVFGKNDIPKDRLIATAVDMIYTYMNPGAPV